MPTLSDTYGWPRKPRITSYNVCYTKLLRANYYLRKALEIGKEVGNEKVVGYACAWLAPTCAEMGQLEDSELFTEKAQDISGRHKDDSTLFTLALRAAGYASYLRGEAGKTKEFGKVLLEQGRRESDVRCTTMGYFYVGQGRQLAGDFPAAIESYKKSIQISVEPLFSHIAKLMLGRCYIAIGVITSYSIHYTKLYDGSTGG